MYARNVKFKTESENQEILTIAEVDAILRNMLNADNDEEYRMLTQNGIDMNVDVFTHGTRIKINNTTYNDLIEDAVYSTNNISRIYSVVSESPAEGVIVFTMADK